MDLTGPFYSESYRHGQPKLTHIAIFWRLFRAMTKSFSGVRQVIDKIFVTNKQFILTYDINAGLYFYTHIDSDRTIGSDRDVNFNINASIGVGVQYEPFDLTLIFKVMPDINYIKHKQGSSTSGVGIIGCVMGFEIIYVLYNYKHNK